jgi:tRNA pseudouridine55 synthase
MNGFFLLYKKKGISSFKSIIRARDKLSKLSNIPFKNIKAGHAGTLDPLAEGLLLCSVGKSTKFLSYLLLNDKKYICEIFLGKNSTTDDSEGEKYDIDNKVAKLPTYEEVKFCINKFIGSINQKPPSFSALKVNGKRACDRVRGGENIELRSRKVEIYNIKIIKYEYPIIKLEVHCGTGTYVRSLARDIGEYLKLGGYIVFLKRTKIANFDITDSVLPENLLLKSIKNFTVDDFDISYVSLENDIKDRLIKGQKISIEKDIKDLNSEDKKEVLLCDIEKNIFGFGKIKDKILFPKKIVN